MKSMLLALALVMTLPLVPGGDHFLWVVAADPERGSDIDLVPGMAEKGDPMAMYMMGRRAYDAARISGDMTEALQWAFRVLKVKRMSGNHLLKMIYLQLGGGVHKDFVQAYVWLSEAIAGGDDYLIPWRKRLAAKMKPEQIAQAKQLAGE